ncbi:MAG: outer membrane protein assembly factor BamD [Planctomycetota bacterium]
MKRNLTGLLVAALLLAVAGRPLAAEDSQLTQAQGQWGQMSPAARAAMINKYRQNAQNVSGGVTQSGELDPNGNISTQAQNQTSLKNLQDLLKKAQDALKQSQYLTASKLAALIVSVEGTGTEGLHDSALQILMQLEQKAEATYDEAEDAYIKRDFDTATDDYAVIVSQFPASNVFLKARARLVEIRNNPVLASKAALAVAQKTEEGEDYYTAVKLYQEVIQNYPDTAAAIKAKKAIAAIQADPAKKAKLDAKAGAMTDAQIETQYTLACNYTDMKPTDEDGQKLFNKGMAIFQDIVDHYPKSSFAAKAQAKLEALGKLPANANGATTTTAN